MWNKVTLEVIALLFFFSFTPQRVLSALYSDTLSILCAKVDADENA